MFSNGLFTATMRKNVPCIQSSDTVFSRSFPPEPFAQRKTEPELEGLTVAVNPKLWPNPWGEFGPTISDELDTEMSQKGKKLPNGWQISTSAFRTPHHLPLLRAD